MTRAASKQAVGESMTIDEFKPPKGAQDSCMATRIVVHGSAERPATPQTEVMDISDKRVSSSASGMLVKEQKEAVPPRRMSEGAPAVNSQSPEAKHRGVLADGWSAYLKRVFTHFFIGEPGDRPWANVLMVFLILAIIADKSEWSNSVLLVFTLLAIMPFAERLGYVTEQLAIHTNETMGGLLNATFGNATEMIVAIFAIKKGLLRLVQVSLLGSVLSNLLLVLGCSFFFGGLKQPMQYFKKTSSGVNSGLLLLSVMALMFPAVLAAAGVEMSSGHSSLSLSRFTSVVLLLTYIAYLYYQLKTHSFLYEDVKKEDEEFGNAKVAPADTTVRHRNTGHHSPSPTLRTPGQESDHGHANTDDNDEKHEEIPILGFWGAIVGLGVVTVVISILSDFMVKAIEGAAKSWGVPNVFIGVIIIPIAGNAAEHASAVIFAMKNRMEIAIGIAIGSSIQIAMFVTPVMIIIAWGMDQPMGLNFQLFETATLFLSVIIVSILIQKGQSTWLSGLMLIVGYLIVAASFFVHKNDAESVTE